MARGNALAAATLGGLTSLTSPAAAALRAAPSLALSRGGVLSATALALVQPGDRTQTLCALCAVLRRY